MQLKQDRKNFRSFEKPADSGMESGLLVTGAGRPLRAEPLKLIYRRSFKVKAGKSPAFGSDETKQQGITFLCRCQHINFRYQGFPYAIFRGCLTYNYT
ncbi:MAG TPA: hypothetical protein DCR95_10115 [Desulfobacter sp.]|nr:hypothetical protein [Desulfobacter sp.]